MRRRGTGGDAVGVGEAAEVVVEAAVLLHQHDEMVDRRLGDPARGAAEVLEVEAGCDRSDRRQPEEVAALDRVQKGRSGGPTTGPGVKVAGIRTTPVSVGLPW